jgi:hypothetical protein
LNARTAALSNFFLGNYLSKINKGNFKSYYNLRSEMVVYHCKYFNGVKFFYAHLSSNRSEYNLGYLHLTLFIQSPRCVVMIQFNLSIGSNVVGSWGMLNFSQDFFVIFVGGYHMEYLQCFQQQQQQKSIHNVSPLIVYMCSLVTSLHSITLLVLQITSIEGCLLLLQHNCGS